MACSTVSPQIIPHTTPRYSAFEDDFLATLKGMDVFSQGSLGMSIPGDGIYTGDLLVGAEGSALMPELADYQSNYRGVGFFTSEYTLPLFSYDSGEVKVLNDGQHVISARESPIEVPSHEEPAFKFGRLSKEERLKKIYRFLEKRSRRNFSKNIKYECRKTLADSRPRVRGRFAKNDEFGEAGRPNSNNHDDEDDDNAIFEDDAMDLWNIFD